MYWLSGRSLATSLTYQYQKTDTGMICSLNELLTYFGQFIHNSYTGLEQSGLVHNQILKLPTQNFMIESTCLQKTALLDLTTYRSIIKVLFTLHTSFQNHLHVWNCQKLQIITQSNITFFTCIMATGIYGRCTCIEFSA